MDLTAKLAEEVVNHCLQRGFTIAPALAVYFLRGMLVSSPKDATNAAELTSQKMQEMVDHASLELCRSDSPAVEAMKLHASMLSKQQELKNAQRTTTVHHKAKSQSLLMEACRKTDKHMKVFGDVVLYVIHETGLYNDAVNKDMIQKETMTALESVIPHTSIESFIAQADSDKLKQMDELWRIVWGIRLFNKKSNKGGAGITDIPQEIATVLQELLAVTQQQVHHMASVCADYEAVLSADSGVGLEPNQRSRYMEEYANRRVYELWASRLLAELTSLSAKFATLRSTHDSAVTEVASLVNSAISVPKSQIYPKFILLAEKWEAMKLALGALKDWRQLTEVLMQFQSSFAVTLKPSLVEETKKVARRREPEPAPNPALLEKEINSSGDPAKGVQVQYYPTLTALTSVQNGGFCPVAWVVEGLLKAGRPALGYLEFQSRFFRFSSLKSLHAFAANPAAFVNPFPGSKLKSDQIAAIPVLELDSSLPSEMYLQGTRAKASAAVQKVKAHAETQTGQILPYKNYQYEWNEWALRRIALKLANLRAKQTRASQTTACNSHFRRDAHAQCYARRQSGTQTGVDAATNPAHTAQYVAGLRGDPLSRLKVVRMTFDE